MLRPVLAALALAAHCAAEEARVWQPVIDYTISFPGDRPDAAPMINPFENFTSMASDFGWMGPGEGRIDAKAGIIRVKPEGEWTGAWHSLAGLATNGKRTLDPTDLTGLGGDPAVRCGVREIALNASGRGMIRLELADVQREVVWEATATLDSDRTIPRVFPVDPATLGRIKFLNWIVEPGSGVQISSVGFLAEPPEMPLEEWAFRISLGKLRRCHDAQSGLTRDRGHLPANEFDSLASTGMHALASALGAAEGMLDRKTVAAEIGNTVAALRRMETASGFFPHFVHRRNDGTNAIVPGTEFSTVDTAIALHSLVLATRVLGLDEMNRQVAEIIAGLDFDAVTDADGWIGHGFQEDGKNPLESKWQDWGGETALVLALEAMVPGRTPRGRMSGSGEIYRGVGFIAEIQSLFYPDFDRPEPDLVSGIRWREARRALLDSQIAYPRENLPASAAALTGIFGLSAGEAGMPGTGYTANGTDVIGVRWFHPHYMLMGLALSGGGDAYGKGLRDLHATHFLYPFGLPENIEAGLRLHNPMQGSLNASFETLSAYHGWKKRNNPANFLDKASLGDPLIRKAAARFYPAAR